MKKSARFTLTLALFYCACVGYAQPADGSTAMDWTMKDLAAKSYNLYQTTDSGKAVIIDYFYTLCHPCWDHHQTHELEHFYVSQGIAGTNKARVYMIEGSGPITTVNDIKGLTANTIGNWTTGCTYPILKPNQTETNKFNTDYNALFAPIVMLICPDKKIYDLSNMNYDESTFISFMNSKCTSLSIKQNQKSILQSIYPNPTNSNNVFISFTALEQNAVTITLTDVLGRNVYSENLGNVSGEYNYKLHFPETCSNGLYILSLQIGKELVTEKISLQRK